LKEAAGFKNAFEALFLFIMLDSVPKFKN